MTKQPFHCGSTKGINSPGLGKEAIKVVLCDANHFLIKTVVIKNIGPLADLALPLRENVPAVAGSNVSALVQGKNTGR